MRPDWVELEEFPDYAINQFGEIANMKSGLPRKTSINQQGIVKISLYRGKELVTRSVAILVAERFVEGQTPLYNTPIHLDGNKLNCRADNLMWRPRWFAVKYHQQFFDPVFHRARVSIVEIDTGQQFETVKDACITFGLHHHDVYKSFSEETYTPLTRQEFRLLESDLLSHE